MAIIEHYPPQPGDAPATLADIAKARELLGYEPRIGIEEGIERFVAWFREASGEIPASASAG